MRNTPGTVRVKMEDKDFPSETGKKKKDHQCLGDCDEENTG